MGKILNLTVPIVILLKDGNTLVHIQNLITTPPVSDSKVSTDLPHVLLVINRLFFQKLKPIVLIVILICTMQLSG